MKQTVLTVTLNPAVDKTVTVKQLVVAGLNRIQDVRIDAGGKGINVAKVLRRFEADVQAWGLKAGHQGRVIEEKLREYGITSHFLEAEGQTRTNLKVVDEATMETTELNEPGFAPSEALIAKFVSELREQLPYTGILVLGGSLPPGVPPDFYKRLIEIAKESGVPAILDADGEALAHGIEAAPYAIKPNIHELEALFGETLDTDERLSAAVRKLLGKGIRVAIVSMGAEGSLIVGADQAIRATPFKITPQSTVGAGDSMVAAMAYCFLRGLSLEETARWTTAAGSVTASKPGTDVCTLAEVQEKLELVQLSGFTALR
jgi:1-phosphofructokinase